jgi:hypothetical protein
VVNERALAASVIYRAIKDAGGYVAKRGYVPGDWQTRWGTQEQESAAFWRSPWAETLCDVIDLDIRAVREMVMA